MAVCPNNLCTIAVAPPPAVMIIPDASSPGPPGWWGKTPDAIKRYGVLHDNWRFAQQWAKWPQQQPSKLRQNRVVQTMPLLHTTPAPQLSLLQSGFVPAIRAASQAATGGEIIFFVGHGSDAEPPPGTPPDPKHPNVASFDLMPESDAFINHKLKMTAEALELRQRLQQQQRHPGGVKMIMMGHDADLNEFLTAMRDAGSAMRAARITMFTILSCHVGASSNNRNSIFPEGPAFVQGLADLLGVPVRAYQGFVDTREVPTTGPPAQLHIWVSPTHDPPTGEPSLNTKDTTLPEFHDVPVDLSVVRSPATP
jgi:hypothetical protein